MKAVERIALSVWHTPMVGVFSRHSKLYKFVSGRDGLLTSIRSQMEGCSKEVIWIHAASLGEYGVARPLIRMLRSEDRSIVLTFFSPSAYEVLRQDSRQQKEVSHIFYLPWDTDTNVKEFLDILKPSRAIFIISEYWLNCLSELQRRDIPTHFVSSFIPDDSYLLKWYGRPLRKAIPPNTRFMVLDENSKANLCRIGFKNVTITGDPLFDNAIRIAQTPYENAVIERFCATARKGVFIAGSISDKNDMKMVCVFANTHPDVKCIFVPHEISETKLNEIKYSLKNTAQFYSDSTEDTDFSPVQVLIIDFMGALSRIYRYAHSAYVGGGFTPYLHSVIEPVVYGIPVSFGPNIQRKITPRQMMHLGIGQVVRSAKELSGWFEGLQKDSQRLAAIRKTALEYVGHNAGATTKVVETIMGDNRLRADVKQVADATSMADGNQRCVGSLQVRED